MGGRIYCSFWFKNPLTNEDSLVLEHMKSGESNMSFVKRIKEYINSNLFARNVKQTIIEDAEKHSKKNKLHLSLNDVRKELDGLTFNVKVDLD